MSRVEFSKPTKELVAKRSAYRCSMPGYNRSTIGPENDPDKFSLTGVAAHIHSASPGGPRGTGGLNEDELGSPENAIWLCADHARLIDSDSGKAYTPATLISYKALHEAAIAREQRGICNPIGWFHKLTIHHSPVFKLSSECTLGKLNLLVGNNASGKTAICEWLTGFKTASNLKRWIEYPPRGEGLDLELTLFNPTEQNLSLRINNLGEIEYLLNGMIIPFQPLDLRFVYHKSTRIWEQYNPDDLEMLADLLSISKEFVPHLIPYIENYGTGSVTKLHFVKEDEVYELKATVKGTAPDLYYGALSGSEQVRVKIEFAIGLANFISKYAPTILLLDGLSVIVGPWFKYIAEYLSDPQRTFQTIAAIVPPGLEIDRIRWGGWEIIRLIGKVTNVGIDQNIRVS